MNLLSSPGRRWVASAIAIWLVVVAYIGTMLYLVGRYQPNLIADQNRPSAMDSLYQTTGGRLYWLFAPAWHYNRYAIPMLLGTAICVTILAWAVRRREAVAA
jgi:hypothetical protein